MDGADRPIAQRLDLGRLLGALPARLDPTLVDLDASLTRAAGQRVELELGPAEGTLELLGRRLTVAAGAVATVRVALPPLPHPCDPELDLVPPPGHVLVVLDLAAKTETAGRVRARAGAVTLTPSARLDARLDAGHLIALPGSLSLRRGLRTLVADAAATLPPGLRPPAPLAVSTLTAEVALDLGLEARLGSRVDFAFTPFEELSEPLEARFQAALRATLGLELNERLKLVVAGLGATRPGWVRLRVERQDRRRLTLGATLALQLRYRLGSPLLALLDAALEEPLWVRLRPALAELDAVAEAFAAGDLDEARRRLGDDAVTLLADLLGVDDLFRWLATDRGASAFLADVRGLLAAYDRVVDEGLLGDLWERLLGQVELEAGSPLRQALAVVAALEPDDLDPALDRLLHGPERIAVELLEVLSDTSLEELVLGGEAARTAVAAAAARARAAAALLDSVPGELEQRVRAFAERHGLALAVERLRLLGDPGRLRAAAGTAAGRLAERLLGAALDAVDEQDLTRLARWAQRLAAAFDHLERLDRELRAALAELDGEAGCSLALELDRATRRGAILDLEVPPERLPELAPALRAGSLSRLLDLLAPADGTDPAEPGFLLHDCLLTSSRLRVSAVDLLSPSVDGGGSGGWSRSRGNGCSLWQGGGSSARRATPPAPSPPSTAAPGAGSRPGSGSPSPAAPASAGRARADRSRARPPT